MNTELRYALAFGVTLVATLVLTPLAAGLANRVGIVDRPRFDRLHRTATPYLGGVAIAAALAIAAVTAATTSAASWQVVAILAGALALGGLGLVDDARTVGPVVKLVVEMGAGAALWVAGIRAGFFGIELLDAALTILWVVAVVNAVNMLDNMDGVVGGVVAISSFGFFAIAAAQGDYLVGSLALAVSGASLGFLRYNFPPARIFLGDTGSLMTGFLLAALGLKLDLWGPSPVVRAVIPVLALAVPLFDMVLVVLARLRDGRPVYLGATDHTAHRLAAKGMQARTVALIAYAVQAVCTAFAVQLGQASTRAVLVTSVAVSGTALVGWAFVLRMEVRVPELPGNETDAHRAELRGSSVP